jgi:hypothetical protein
VILRIRLVLAVAASVWMALPGGAQEPARLQVQSGSALTPVDSTINQKLADTIADHLRQSGVLHRYIVNVSYQDGTVELTGTVSDPAQRDNVERIVRGVPGVENLVDHLSCAASNAILPVQASTLSSEAAPLAPNCPVPPNGILPPGGSLPGGPGFAVEPQPIAQMPAPGPYDLNPPKMPPYAWPTYAPYNNYSRVAYPTLYPYKAFPFIGPFYPFPHVPLGWRAVKLEWQDGHWWLSRYATPHDWWMLRYW